MMLRANDTKARLRNSEVVTFETITRAGGIKTREGKTIPPGMLSLSYGYVVTSHKSQGQTRGTAGMVGGFDAKAIYVSATRAKQAVRIYTTSKEALLWAAGRPGARMAAVEALKSQTQTSDPPMDTQRTETNQVREACLSVIDGRLATLNQSTSSSRGVSQLSEAERDQLSPIRRPYSKAELDGAARPRLERLRADALRYQSLSSGEQRQLLNEVAALGGNTDQVERVEKARRELSAAPAPQSPQVEIDAIRPRHRTIAAAETAKRQIAELRSAGKHRAAERVEGSSLLDRINATRIADGKSLLSARDLRELRRGHSPAQRLSAAAKKITANIKSKRKAAGAKVKH